MPTRSFVEANDPRFHEERDLWHVNKKYKCYFKNFQEF